MEQTADTQEFVLPRMKSDSYYNIPLELRELKQWVVHKNKVPHQVSGKMAKSDDSNTWDTFKNVVQAARSGRFSGIGFMFSKDDHYIGVDIDKCYINGKFNEVAEILIDSLDSYTEFSPSGTGVHIIVKGSLPDYVTQTGFKNASHGVELYSFGRYFTFTGNIESDNEIQERTDEVEEIIEKYFTKEQLTHYTETTLNAEPFNLEDDETTWQKMLANTRTGNDIAAMRNGDLIRSGDWSSTDYYLCQELAYYCDKDFIKMDRMFRASGLYRDKWDKMHGSMTYGEQTLLKAAASKKKTISDYKQQDDGFQLHVAESDSFVFPKGYFSKGSCLFREVEKKKPNGEVEIVEYMICRQTPIITRSFMNLEHPQLYHEVTWSDEGKVYSETVPAGNLATRNKLLELADYSLAVNDGNVKELIRYFDMLNLANAQKREHLVERLGHIKNTFFIHPQLTEGVTILPKDVGERQQLEAFQVSGTTEEWISSVLQPIKRHPKALVMLVASFTSVILKDLKLQPFIVDLSGTTSQGKTTVLRAAASVWGTEHLVNEWNMTKVAMERKASFLNSFCLLLDDSRKADERQLQGFIYNFSGGRSKGRGSVRGSQQEYTWNNLLLSTGEVSLNDYAEGAGGVAARVLPLTGLPFNNPDYEFFNQLYNAIEQNYGAVGIDFLKKWADVQKDALSRYQEISGSLQRTAQGNEVTARIARHYAAIVYTGELLNQFFNAGIDLKSLFVFFGELNEENKAVDKPKQLLEMILNDLDADRGSIYYEYEPNRTIKAIHKSGVLYLLPAYLKEILKTEEKTTRSEWLRRGMSIEKINKGKKVDYGQLKHKGRNYTCVAIQPHTLEDLGFDFSEEYQKG